MRRASRLWKALAATAMMTTLIALVPMSGAGANHVTPVQYQQSGKDATIPGDATLACRQILEDEDAIGIKLNSTPTSGPFSQGGFSVELTTTDGGVTFDFTDADPDVSAVIVKGGASGDFDTNVYLYDPAADADTGLTAPAAGQISHVVFCFGEGSTEVAGDLSIEKTAVPSYTTTFPWTIEKSVDPTGPIVTDANTVDLDYTVVATKGAGVDTAHAVSGVITITNPNVDHEVTITDITDAIEDDATAATCVLDFNGADPGTGTMPETIAADSTITVDYACTFTDAAAALATASNTARVAWTDPIDEVTPLDAFWDQLYDWEDADVTIVDDEVLVKDLFDTLAEVDVHTLLDPPEAPGTIADTTTFEYTRTVDVPANGCYTYDNTATVYTADGTTVLDSDDASVEVCRRLVDGGFTIGFWGNKNGQAELASNVSGYCDAIALYPAVLGSPTCTNAQQLQGYVKGVLSAAKANDDGTAMFEAQFLATVLNTVKGGSAFSNQGVMVDGALLGAPGTTCMTISDLLAAANAEFTTLDDDKSDLMTVKDYFDDINNNVMPACTP